MNKNHKGRRKRSSLKLWIVTLIAIPVLVVCLLIGMYQPDRPVDMIAPSSSNGPAFVVQVIRPRAGLPLGGLVPPQLFGVVGHLGFDSSSFGARVVYVDRERIELTADGWNLLIVAESEGKISTETQIEFDLVLQDRPRRVRCRPGNPAVGTLEVFTLAETRELAGNFDIELAHCEDAETGKRIPWPPKPLILHGSFDRLPLSSDSE